MPAARETCPSPIPARAGIGLRAPHFQAVLAGRPDTGWFEVHSENYFGAGGPPHHYLEQVRRDYPLSLHGVGLSLGSSDPLDRDHLRQLKALIARYQPGLVSEHLCWSSIGGRHLNDLLPLPYTDEALRHVVGRIVQVQDRLGREILIENVSSYLEFRDSTIPEWEFLAAVATQAGCGILLDVNNIFVSAHNHGFDAQAYLDAMPAARVRELHLAGHTRRRHDDGESANAPGQMTGRTSAASRASGSARGPRLDPIGESANAPSRARGPRLDPIGESANAPSRARGPRLDPIGEILIDTHDARVAPEVWALYQRALARLGPRPTLIEWDSDLPPLDVLLDEAAIADRLLEAHRADAA